MRALDLGICIALVFAAGCKQRRDETDLKVVNGIAAGANILQAVVKLDLGGGGICTGAFLNQSIVLTAAHCTYNVSTVSVGGIQSKQIFLANTGFKDVYAAAQADSWQGAKAMTFVSQDISLVQFPANTASSLGITKFFPVEKGANINGINVFVTGFGETTPNNAGTSGTKHWGRNTVDSSANGIITVGGGTSATSGEDSHSSRGDSGGPLLYVGTDAPGDETIVGVVSLVPNTTGVATAHYCAVQGPAARALFDYAIGQGIEAFSY